MRNFDLFRIAGERGRKRKLDDYAITDHCYEPPSYSEDEIREDEFRYKDECAYLGCGLPEIKHLWTVEAYMDNELALR